MSGGFTYRVPYDCTQPCSVKAKPWSCSPKYSTMSFRSNSPCTSTSSPSSSCSLSVRAIWSAIKASYSCGVSLPSWSFFRAARTSAVCGNEPIVVVGNTGRRSCRLRRAACGEARRMSFSLTPAARCLTAGSWIRRDERRPAISRAFASRSEEHTSELQSRLHLVCRLLLEKKKKTIEYQEQLNHPHSQRGEKKHRMESAPDCLAHAYCSSRSMYGRRHRLRSSHRSRITS